MGRSSPLARVIHQAHHSTTPIQVQFAALSMFQLGARQDLWDNVHQNLLMNFHSDPFPAFPVSSSGVFVFRHLLDGRGFRVHNGDLQIAVHNTVVSTSLQPKQLCDLVRVTLVSVRQKSTIMILSLFPCLTWTSVPLSDSMKIVSFVKFATCQVTTNRSQLSSPYPTDQYRPRYLQ